jgi:hypothetical protein
MVTRHAQNPAPKGHWPKGRRRSDIGRASAESIARWLVRVLQGDEPDVSLRGISRATGISDRSLRRYIGGDRWPNGEHAALIDRVRRGDLRGKAARLPSGGARR